MILWSTPKIEAAAFLIAVSASRTNICDITNYENSMVAKLDNIYVDAVSLDLLHQIGKCYNLIPEAFETPNADPQRCLDAKTLVILRDVWIGGVLYLWDVCSS